MSDRALQIPFTGASTGSSFDREMRELVWRRGRLVFLLGLGVSLVGFAVNQWALHGHPPVTGLEPWFLPVGVAHALSFALGLGALHLLRDRVAPQALVVTVLAVNILLAAIAPTLFHPERDVFFAIALILFVHAAFIPCYASQVALAALAAVAVPGAVVGARALLPEVAAYWASAGGSETFREHLIWETTGTLVLAVVSVLVSRTLYSLRKTAHRAERLGNYLIERELGSGGMGDVYVARHSLICRPTAVKVLKREAGDGTALARFEREVQLSASLTHPNTITIFDFGRTADDTFYYAMEYLDGMDLQRLVERFGPLPAERAIHILLQACGSLAEAHARGIIHRDVKPSNIFLTHRGGVYDFVKVLDFGLARDVRGAVGDGADITKTGMVFGTPRYISPEAVTGNGKVDARADVYNLGAVAYWILTGRPLFSGSSSLDLLIDHVKTVPVPPSRVSELPIPEALDAVVVRCLEKDPDDRFGCVTDLEKALRVVPLEEPWTPERARRWWSLHAAEEMLVTECHSRSEVVEGAETAVRLLPPDPKQTGVAR